MLNDTDPIDRSFSGNENAVAQAEDYGRNAFFSKPWYKKWWGMIIILVIIVFILFFCIYLFLVFRYRHTANTLTANIPEQAGIPIIKKAANKNILGDGHNYWLGTSSPQITIVEFSDYACPYCQASFPVIREISLKYSDRIKFIFRDFPVHENSLELAMAARCAGGQGRFWQMHDKLFQYSDSITAGELKDLANDIGADIDKFSACMAEARYKPSIQKDYTDGEFLGITGTPTWYINGYKLQGAVPRDQFISIIEKLIK